MTGYQLRLVAYRTQKRRINYKRATIQRNCKIYTQQEILPQD
jgi:hypothetical protein